MKVVKKTIKYKKKFSFFDTIQLILGIVIMIGYLISLIPFYFDNLFYELIILLIIQFAISLVRLNLLNALLEIFIIGLTVLGLIPLFGYLFRIIAFIAVILDTVTFKSYKMKKYVEVKTYRSKNPKKTEKKRRISENKVEDAEFEER